VTREKDELERNAAAVSAQLANLGVQIGARSSEVSHQFAGVHQAQNELLGRLKFNNLVQTTYEPASELCKKLQAASRAYALPDDLTDEGLRKLTVHKTRYTMVRENELHAHALNPGAQPAENRFDASSGAIDLFDEPAPGLAAATLTPSADAPAPPATSLDFTAPDAPAPKTEDLGDGIELF
jgi:hypothetical protein